MQTGGAWDPRFVDGYCIDRHLQRAAEGGD
jgi:hypothetical protein